MSARVCIAFAPSGYTAATSWMDHAIAEGRLMKYTVVMTGFGLIVAATMVVQSQAPPQVIPHDPAWAFPITEKQLPAEDATPKSVPGSSKTYVSKEIDDLLNPPDWFPNEHPPAPPIVLKGHGDALACGVCHLMNGLGHPESASVAGFTAGYIAQQMADFKSGVRKDLA